MSELERTVKKLELVIMRLEDTIDALPWDSESDIIRRIAMEQGELEIIRNTIKALEDGNGKSS